MKNHLLAVINAVFLAVPVSVFAAPTSGNILHPRKPPEPVPKPDPFMVEVKEIPDEHASTDQILMTLKMTAKREITLVHVKAYFTTASVNPKLLAHFSIYVNGDKRMQTAVPVAANEPVILSVFPSDLKKGQTAFVDIYADISGARPGDTAQIIESEIESDRGTDQTVRKGPVMSLS